MSVVLAVAVLAFLAPAAVLADGDGDGFEPPTDCNDHDATINPQGHEIPGNAIDENCNGVLGTIPVVSALVRLDLNTAHPLARITRLEVHRIEAGSTVTTTCKGQGCPFRRRTVQPIGATVDFTRPFLDTKLERGTKVQIAVTRPETIGRVVRYVFLWVKLPKVVKRCFLPGGTQPTPCP